LHLALDAPRKPIMKVLLQIRSALLLVGISAAALFNLANAGECPRTGGFLEATEKVPIRASPPTEKFLFFVGAPGDKLGELSVGTKVKVVGSETISALLQKDVWIKTEAPSGVVGWVYCGAETKATNFKIVK
jgi:hypothetical protein